MFADIVINFNTCDRKTPKVDTVLEALNYFASSFHIFDATIILTSFIFEVTLQGVEEEVASLIVMLRLLRVVKIVDELSVGAEEEMEELENQLVESEKEVQELKRELDMLRAREEL